MKQYRVVKAWPGVEVGYIAKLNEYENIDIDGFNYSHSEIRTMLKEGWIEEVRERKTLDTIFLNKVTEVFNGFDPIKRSEDMAKLAKDHYLGLLDEAVEEWDKQEKTETYLLKDQNVFLRKYLESEGQI